MPDRAWKSWCASNRVVDKQLNPYLTIQTFMSKRKLESRPPPLQCEDEDEEDKGSSVTLHANFLSFFDLLDPDRNDDDEDDDEEEEEADSTSTITLTSAVNRMCIDMSVDDAEDTAPLPIPTVDSLMQAHTQTQTQASASVKVKTEEVPTILPRISASDILRSIPSRRAQDQLHVPTAGHEHAVYFSKSEITDITRRVSNLYATLRHVQCQVQIHSVRETDVPVQGPDELKEPHLPLLPLKFIERELAVAISSSSSSSSATYADDDDNVFSDEKAPPRQYSPCARGNQCVGLADQWAVLCSIGNSSEAFTGSILPALFYPEEMDKDNGHVAKSRNRPCFFCLVKEINEAWIVFAVNRLSLYTLAAAPIQCFRNTHGPDEFNRSVLRMPGTHVFNGLVAPVLMYVHSKFLWDFDTANHRWRVNLDALKHPVSSSSSSSSSYSSDAIHRQPGVVLDSTRPGPAATSKKPLN